MRLSTEQVQLIARTVAELAGADATVRVFGSRLDDTARGGDIDLLLEVPEVVEHPALLASAVAARLERALGGVASMSCSAPRTFRCFRSMRSHAARDDCCDASG